MKILITGGAGYIGTELAYKLAEDPAKEIIIYDNLSRSNHNLFIGVQKFKPGNIRFVEGDILDSRKLKKVIAGANAVVHLAAKVTTPFSDQNPHLFEQVNHWGTAELSYALENSNISKLIYMSSVSVYGATEEEVDVDFPVNPKTFYGISKMRGEEHVLRLFSKFPTFIIRCGNVYGYSKSMRFDAVINKFMLDANFKGRITINGNGNQCRPFIHVAKLSSALVNILNADLKSNRFDLVDRNITVNEICDTLKQLYPDLETISVNQHLSLRDLRVKPNPFINGFISVPSCTFYEELAQFKSAFTF